MLIQNLPLEQRIFEGSKLDFLVMNRAEIKDFSPSDSCIVISITDPANSEAEIFDSPFLLGILRLKFDDVDGSNKFKFVFEESKDVFMDAEHAEKILSFVKKYSPDISLIVCQCEQGVSRSPAIAAALLSKILQNEDEHFLKNYWANRWVYDLIIQANQKAT